MVKNVMVWFGITIHEFLVDIELLSLFCSVIVAILDTPQNILKLEELAF